MADIGIKEEDLWTASRQIRHLVTDMLAEQRLPLTTVLTAMGVEIEHQAQNHPYAKQLCKLGRAIYRTWAHHKLSSALGQLLAPAEPTPQEELN